MFEKPSLMTRVAVGKTAGLVFGAAGFVLLPYFLPDAGLMLRWGVLLWYITMGAVIGVMGVFTWHPILRMPMPWWFSAPLMGAWMNFVLTFFAYDDLAAVMSTTFGGGSWMSSPFWFVLEGALIGLIIGYLATRFGGEGPETAGK